MPFPGELNELPKSVSDVNWLPTANVSRLEGDDATSDRVAGLAEDGLAARCWRLGVPACRGSLAPRPQLAVARD